MSSKEQRESRPRPTSFFARANNEFLSLVQTPGRLARKIDDQSLAALRFLRLRGALPRNIQKLPALASAEDSSSHGTPVRGSFPEPDPVVLAPSAPLPGEPEDLMVDLVGGTPAALAEQVLARVAQSSPEELAGCIEGLFAAEDPELRLVALRAAPQLGPEHGRPFFEQGARDPAPNVRHQTIAMLVHLRTSWALALLRSLCPDADPRVRAAALEALASSLQGRTRRLMTTPAFTDDAQRVHRLSILLRRARGQSRAPALDEPPTSDDVGEHRPEPSSHKSGDA